MEKISAYLSMSNKIELWDSFLQFLYTDKKLNIEGTRQHYLKSRYHKIAVFFKDKEWTRDNFNLLLWDMKQQGLSSAYANNIIKLGKHLDDFLGKHELENFTYFKEDIKAIEPLTPLEIQRLAKVSVPYRRNRHLTNRKYRALIFFLGLTGCRISEVLKLEWKDCNEKMIVFRDTKNGSDRIFPMPPLLWSELERLPRTRYVFGDTILDTTSINADLKIRASLIGLNKRVYNHLFRHSFITEMLKPEKGLNAIVVANLVGHKDLASTQRYTHYMLEDMMMALYQHPLLKSEQNLDLIVKRLKDMLERLVDKQKYNLVIDESKTSVSINLKEI